MRNRERPEAVRRAAQTTAVRPTAETPEMAETPTVETPETAVRPMAEIPEMQAPETAEMRGTPEMAAIPAHRKSP